MSIARLPNTMCRCGQNLPAPQGAGVTWIYLNRHAVCQVTQRMINNAVDLISLWLAISKCSHHKLGQSCTAINMICVLMMPRAFAFDFHDVSSIIILPVSSAPAV